MLSGNDIKQSLLLFSNSAAAAAAKSLQSCPTLCDPIGGSPPGSVIPGILQARILEWVAISFSVVSNSFKTPWTEACQASLSFTICLSLLKLRSIESVMLSNYLMLCQLFSFCLSSFPANTGGAANPHGELTYPRSKLLKCKAANPEPTLLTSCSMRLHSGSPSPAPMDPGPHD